MNDPLQLPLRDIHLPAEPLWWPPAPGWWILFALIISIMALVWWWYRRRQRIKRSAVNMARQELELLQSKYNTHRDARQTIADLSILLRRLSISAYPRTETASLTGEEWLQFLDRPLTDTPFTRGAGRILVEAPYRPEVKEEELIPLIALCRRWIDNIAGNNTGRTA